MIITIVAGARPNFMKVAPIIKAIEAARLDGRHINYRLVHTGQHFDAKMSGTFFEELGIPHPHVNLNGGGGSQAEQTAAIMVSFENELIHNPPDVVLVVGDVNSTMACTISAKKLCVPVVHVEAGIRSGDMTMPEEINRIVTDSICDHFFTTSVGAGELLKRSGVDESSIHFVGNTMIDSLKQNLSRLKKPEFWDCRSLDDKKYFLLTLHRPGNVDVEEKLTSLLGAVLDGTEDFPVIFPVHPRTKKTLENCSYEHKRLIQVNPLGYLEFIYLLRSSRAIITDSGGITEEATILDVPCLTLRNSTERPETVLLGTNVLVGTDPQNLRRHLKILADGNWKKGRAPELWDGKASDRIVDILMRLY